MLMDGLTKVGTFPKLMCYLSTGLIDLQRTADTNKKNADKPIILRESNTKLHYEEYEIVDMTEAPLP